MFHVPFNHYLVKLYIQYFLVNNAALSYLAEIDDVLLDKAFEKSKSFRSDFYSSDIQLVQSFIFDEIARLTNLKKISQHMDTMVHYKNFEKGKIFLTKEFENMICMYFQLQKSSLHPSICIRLQIIQFTFWIKPITFLPQAGESLKEYKIIKNELRMRRVRIRKP